MKYLGFLTPEKIIGKRLKLDSTVLSIIGVVKNFHYESLYHTIDPLILMSPKAFPGVSLNPHRFASLKLKDVSPEFLYSIEQSWNMLELSTPFSFSFLKDGLAHTYKSEFQLTAIIKGASVIAILIACLGLRSLAQLLLKVKLKEIAIRKVLGASSLMIYQLFIWQFLGGLLIAFVLALPIAIWYFNSWLSSFAYRISLGWELFLTSGLLLSLFSIGILSINAVRAANQDPVNNLRRD